MNDRDKDTHPICMLCDKLENCPNINGLCDDFVIEDKLNFLEHLGLYRNLHIISSNEYDECFKYYGVETQCMDISQ